MDKSRTELVITATGQELPKEQLCGRRGGPFKAKCLFKAKCKAKCSGAAQFYLNADQGRLLPVCGGQQKASSQPLEELPRSNEQEEPP